MRKILMVGTALAQSPYANGEQAYAPEDDALTRYATGELSFVLAADARVDVTARRLEMLAAMRMKALQMWANVRGSICTDIPGQTYLVPPEGAAAEYREPHSKLERAEAVRYGWSTSWKAGPGANFLGSQLTNRPPHMLLVRLRSALVCGGRTHPAGALIRLPADLAVTLWGKARAELRENVQRWHFSRWRQQMRGRGLTRVHPSLPVPLSERRRLALAGHLALHSLKDGHTVAAWLDLPAATDLALRLLAPGQHAPETIETAWSAHRALHAYAEGRGSVEAAIAASKAFLPVFEAALAAVPWRRVMDAQHAMVQTWARHGSIPDWPGAGTLPGQGWDHPGDSRGTESL